MSADLAKSAVEWFRAVGAGTGAFVVRQVRHCSKAKGRPGDVEIQIAAGAGGDPIWLLVEAQEQVTPLRALGILTRLAHVRAKGVPTLCSRNISERVAGLCRGQGVSYLDEAGNCRISAPGFYLQVSGKRLVKPAKQPHADPFAAKSSRIVRVLLSHPQQGWQVQELAKEAAVSLGLVAKIKQALLELAFVEERNRRVHLRDPKGLFDAWAAAYEPAADSLRLYVMQKPGALERALAGWCQDKQLRYALTHLAGAWRMAPTVRYQHSTVYVDAATESAAIAGLVQDLRAKPVDTGANLVLRTPADPFVFYDAREIDAVQVVSALQLYLDLKGDPGRGREAAQEILEREIMPRW